MAGLAGIGIASEVAGYNLVGDRSHGVGMAAGRSCGILLALVLLREYRNGEGQLTPVAGIGVGRSTAGQTF